MNAVKLLSHEHAISTLCRVLRVNRSSYYKFLKRQPSRRERENQHIRTCIVELYARTDKRLGCGKLALCLKRDYRISVSSGRVYRLMQTMNLPKMSTIKPRKASKAKSDENGACHNILDQQFDQTAPNIAWVCDFTYIRVGARFLYLCAIMDLYARKIIAYKLSTRIDTQLALDTLDAARAARGDPSGVLFHTDRGSQFTSARFRKRLEELGIVQSFSAKGHPYDNAVMECFFKYLKKEETDRRNYSSRDELNRSLFAYIYGFYNSVRPHSANGGLTPDRMEDLYFSS